jgi:hypothetical protein
MANATSTLALCATEVGEHAVAIDMARCHLKLFEGQGEVETGGGGGGGHGHSHDHSHGHGEESKRAEGAAAGTRGSLLAMWVLRGRGFAALGE